MDIDLTNLDSPTVRLRWTRLRVKPKRKVKRFGFHNVWEMPDGELILLINAVNSVGLGAGYNHANVRRAREQFPEITRVIFNNTSPESPLKGRICELVDVDAFLQSEFAPRTRGDGVGLCSFFDPRHFEMEATEDEAADAVFDGATEDEAADDGEDASASDLELTREECATLGLCYPERRNPKMRTLMSKLIANGLRFEVVNGVRRIS